MLNIGVACDINWDNFILINNKFKKIIPENFRLHAIYGKSLEIINNCCSKHLLNLIRHSSNNLSKIVYNLLKICDIWIIFTNHVEYLTPVRLIIEKCDEYNIKYIIISEHRRHNDYYSFENINNLSFKKILNNLSKQPNDIEEFNIEYYNQYFATKNNNITLTLTPEIRQKIRNCNNNINQIKQDKSIKLLYDKSELKKEKQAIKSVKIMNHLEFNKNRQNYYKT